MVVHLLLRVKVLINIVKVILALGPVFIVEQSAILYIINHQNRPNFKASNPVRTLFLDYGVLYPFSAVVILPLFHFLLKPLFFQGLVLNMFKRIGLGVVLLNISVLLMLLSDLTTNDGNGNLGSLYDNCSGANSSHLLKIKHFHISNEVMHIFLHLILSVSHILLFLGTQEFICCQSPQQMKGFLFGIFLATKSFFQFFSVVIVYWILMTWKYETIDCSTGGTIIILFIGVVGLGLFILSVRNYEYRKRDDICNVHLFAEEYYAKYGSNAVGESLN